MLSFAQYHKYLREDSAAALRYAVKLRKGAYERVRFFDDAMSNITMFKALQKQYPDISFEAYHVKHDGSIRKV